ncbi:MAG: ypdB 2 [Mucilaginibacter sp.]|nr:ypdB 2 [Mucilaginibacter sp.]
MIVDDEDLATSHLRSYISKVSFLNLLSCHKNAADALNSIENEDLQLVFLDINMPDVNGIELAHIIRNTKGANINIIFTTGFEHFALDSYKVDALDYLVKPIHYEDFIRAAYKAKTYIEKNSKQTATTIKYNETDFIFLRVEYELIKVYLKDILYFEGAKDYVKAYTANPKNCIKSLTTMKSLEEKLPINSFMRIHRSFIVSLDKITVISKSTVLIGKIFIPITGQYKEPFKKFIDQWF